MSIDFDKTKNNTVKISVMGVGGGGGNAVNRMCSLRDNDFSSTPNYEYKSEFTSKFAILTDDEMQIEYVALNTDSRVLDKSKADFKVQIGEKLTEGTGAGGNPEIGEKSAEESKEKIASMLKDTKMLIITAGMGGGTGTGASPYIAKIARELGILTVAIVTKPFDNEGKRRMKSAITGIDKLRENVDALLVIPNQKLISEEEDITLAEAYGRADDVLAQTIRSVSEIVSIIGFINLDFADLTAVLQNAGYTHLGVGTAEIRQDNDAILEATQTAISTRLLETSLHGARSVLINFVIPSMQQISMKKVDAATKLITDLVDEDAEIYSGFAEMPELENQVRVTVIATRFGDEKRKVVDRPLFSAPQETVQPTPAERPVEKQAEIIKPVVDEDTVDNDKKEVSEFNMDDIIKMLDRRTNL